MVRNDDYTGFSFNGVHSSTLGIVRVSDGNRFEANLLPSLQDISMEASGRDGAYFYRTNYRKYDLTLNIAFEDMDERQLRFLRRFYKSEGLYSLILDENPYKIYKAKGKGLNNIKYVPFGYSSNRRYRGEGTISFEIYEGVSKSRFKYTDDYTSANIMEWNDIVGDYTVRQVDLPEDPTDNGTLIYTEDPDVNSAVIKEEQFFDFNNLDEWKEASGIVPKGNFDIFYTENSLGCFDLFNAGDVPAPYKLRFYFLPDGTIPDGSLNIIQDGQIVSTITWEGFTQAERDSRTNIAVDDYIEISTKERVIKGFDLNHNKTGRYYMNYFSGDFNPIPLGESKMEIDVNNVSGLRPFIMYDYLYY